MLCENIPAPLPHTLAEAIGLATSCLFSVKLVLLFSREASEPEIVFVDIQKHREFPFGHVHEKNILDMGSELYTCRRAKSIASCCLLCETL